uniref:HEPN domain-containing protein n=1 Tax=Mesocestoides corti TaxID=53468 RepID=A0A5K3FV88_MESCO
MLAKLQRIYEMLIERLKATSDPRKEDAKFASIAYCVDAENALRSAAVELEFTCNNV